MRYLGCGWAEAYHPWSKDSVLFTATELLDHLVKTVIPLKNKRKVPDEVPFELPRMPELPVLRTQTNDLEVWTEEQEGMKLELMLDTLKECEREEFMGIGDQSKYMNEINWLRKKLKKAMRLKNSLLTKRRMETN